ncbi:MAG TPA: hypothetical protein VGL66_15250 [Caulobacteraceae bacterium]|jgi:hypothetical protein
MVNIAALGAGGCTLAAAGICLIAGASERAGRLSAVGLTLIVAAILIPMSPAPIGGPELTFANAMVWIAVVGGCVRVLGVGWGIWLIVPAAVRFVLWPLFHRFLGLIPLWAWFVLVPIGVLLGLTVLVRVGREIGGSVLGDDAAARTVRGWFGGMIGSWGRSKPKALSKPELPRPRASPRLHDFGDER